MSLLVSASQISTFRMCPRKWAFEKLWDVPASAANSDSLSFGTALHGVLERYLGASSTGRSADGTEVDLYPEGWADGLDQEAQDCIKTLVEQAIRDGILARRRDAKVEHFFLVPVIEGDSFASDHVWLQGYIDYTWPGSVVDHKTMRSFRYALTAEQLRTDLQLLIYAMYEIERSGFDTCFVAHNQFSRSGKVRQVSASITRHEIEEHWDLVVVPTCQEMLKARGAQTWRDLEGPREPKACEKYGGCPYLPICTGQETLPEYEARVRRLSRSSEGAPAGPSSKEDPTLPVPETEGPPARPTTILHGCVLSRTENPVDKLTLAQVLCFAVEIVAKTSLEDYYATNAFARRDALYQTVRELVVWLRGKVIEVPLRPTPDEAALLSYLAPHVEVEIVARA